MKLIPLSLLLLATTAAGQAVLLQPGDMVAAVLNGDLAVISSAGSQVATVTVPGSPQFGALAWDAGNPDSVVIAGGGHVTRVTFGTGGVTTATISSQNVGAAQEIVIDPASQVAILLASAALHAVDLTTGALTSMAGSVPAAGTVESAALDPSTGNVFVGTGAGEIWRVSDVPPNGTGVATLLASGLQGSIRSLFVDPLHPSKIIYGVSSANSAVAGVYRIDRNTLVSETVSTAFQPMCNGFFAKPSVMRFDGNGDILGAAGVSACGRIFRYANLEPIPVGGTPATLVAQFSSSIQASVDFTVVGAVPDVFHLDVTAIAPAGGSITVMNPPTGTQEAWLFASLTTAFATGSGPFLGIYPDALTFLLISITAAAQPGNVFHSLGPPPPVTLITPGTLAPFVGTSWDFVMAATGIPAFLGKTNVARVTWL